MSKLTLNSQRKTRTWRNLIQVSSLSWRQRTKPSKHKYKHIKWIRVIKIPLHVMYFVFLPNVFDVYLRAFCGKLLTNFSKKELMNWKLLINTRLLPSMNFMYFSILFGIAFIVSWHSLLFLSLNMFFLITSPICCMKHWPLQPFRLWNMTGLLPLIGNSNYMLHELIHNIGLLRDKWSQTLLSSCQILLFT